MLSATAAAQAQLGSIDSYVFLQSNALTSHHSQPGLSAIGLIDGDAESVLTGLNNSFGIPIPHMPASIPYQSLDC